MDDLGQAVEGPDTVTGLAQFLTDNSAVEPDDEGSDQLASDEPEEGSSDDATDAPADGEDEESKADDDAKKEQASGQKFKVTVKGDDGVERIEEIDETERAAGYLRHGDYTKKTMELADQQRQAYEVVTSKISEAQGHYVGELQRQRALYAAAVGAVSPDQLAALAQSDPAAWAQERQRLDSLNSYISSIDQKLEHERAQTHQRDEVQRQHARQRMAQALQGEGFDIPKLQGVFQAANKAYGFTVDQLKNIDDPALIRMMRDATEYRALKAKVPEVAKKAAAAPKLPAARRPAPQSERATKALDQRFQSGRAGKNDLAAFLQQHERAQRR